MRSKRKPRRGGEAPANLEEANRLKLLGEIIRAGRLNLKSSRSHGHVSQAAFFEVCRNIERPVQNKRAHVCFAATKPDSQRVFIIDVEKGRQRLTPEQKRIIEKVCGWPSGVLDAKFKDKEEFGALCVQSASPPALETETWRPEEEAETPQAPTRRETTLPSSLDIEQLILRTNVSEQRSSRAAGSLAESPTTAESKPAPSQSPRKRRNIDLRGLRILTTHYEPLASRAHIAVDIQEALRPSSRQHMRIAVVCGEPGIGKSQLIAEWWRDHGRKRFNHCTFTLDCARLGGDKILESLSAFFLETPVSELTVGLTERINERRDALVVLDGLSEEDADPALAAGPEGSVPLRHGPDVLAASGRTDRTALRRVKEILTFLALYEARISILLGIQTAEGTDDPLKIEQHLDASSGLTLFRVQRLLPDEGAKMLQSLRVRGLPFADLESLSSRLKGLPISLTAAAHYLRSVGSTQAEQFLLEMGHRGRDFSFFEEFFGHYLDYLNETKFDDNAHPQAYLRLLALMPGPVSKSLIDELLSSGKIRRLERASTAKFERMRIDFVTNQHEQVDVNPFVRGLLRQDLARVVDRGGETATTDRIELHWIHAACARWYLKRLPKDPANFSAVEIEMIEGALYHLLSLRDHLPDEKTAGVRRATFDDIDTLLDVRASPDTVTQFCLDNIVRRFLLDRVHRATRFLGQFETKARLLSLFFESLDHDGKPKYLTLDDQATIYGEMGVCWMHAGRLQLARTALNQAAACLQEVGLEGTRFKPLAPPDEGLKDHWRLWTETVTTRALIFMRMGLDREIVADILDDAVNISRIAVLGALESASEITRRQATLLRSARRVLCRKAQVSLNGGDLAEAERGYALAAEVESRIDGRKLSGDAMRRQIEVIVLRGPCLSDDLALAESLIDAQLDLRVPPGVRRRLSNDIIPMFATKIMLLRAKGEFSDAGRLLHEAMNHEFVLRGECPFAARMELLLEKFRLLIATNAVTPESQRDLRSIAQELEARHHYLLHWDAMLILAEGLAEPERSDVLNSVERQFGQANWLRRKTDMRILREGGSAVMALAC
jgi:hypothetical protein